MKIQIEKQVLGGLKMIASKNINNEKNDPPFCQGFFNQPKRPKKKKL